jgi:YD repeat-containing protein
MFNHGSRSALLRATFLFSFVMGAGSLYAGVNVNNGNFYVAYTDFLITNPGLNLDITRTYNSRSSYVKGFFGVGWSSEFEGYLDIKGADIHYFEGGGGNVVIFKKDGAGWTNNLYGKQNIQKLKDGRYLLDTSVGKKIIFTAKGQLARVTDTSGNFLEFVYENGQISLIKDNFNNQVRISWKTVAGAPRIVRVERDVMKASYSYNEKGQLLKVTGADGVPYSYEYDDEFNMTAIAYNDGTRKEMSYNKTRDWITKFKDQDSWVTSYDYFSDNLDPENKFGTTVVRFKEGSKEKDESRFWYEFRKRADGSRYNHRAVTYINRTVTETFFTECCGTPIEIGQWRLAAKEAGADSKSLAWTNPRGEIRRTKFTYDKDGLLAKKITPDGIETRLTYDPKYKKVAKVSIGGRSYTYSYDLKGNLREANDLAASRKLTLSYSAEGRITKILDLSPGANNALISKDVLFSYDKAGRPSVVKEIRKGGGGGTIKMTYNNRGEVASVLNGEGRTLASEKDLESAREVALTFQSLLEIVQPAGVTLTPEG